MCIRMVIVIGKESFNSCWQTFKGHISGRVSAIPVLFLAPTLSRTVCIRGRWFCAAGSWRFGFDLRVGIGWRWSQRRLQLWRLRGQHVDHINQFGNERRPDSQLRRELFIDARFHVQQRQERLPRCRSGICDSNAYFADLFRATYMWLGGAVVRALDLRLEVAGSIPAAALSSATLDELFTHIVQRASEVTTLWRYTNQFKFKFKYIGPYWKFQCQRTDVYNKVCELICRPMSRFWIIIMIRNHHHRQHHCPK